jgi:hypothetical protein
MVRMDTDHTTMVKRGRHHQPSLTRIQASQCAWFFHGSDTLFETPHLCINSYTTHRADRVLRAPLLIHDALPETAHGEACAGTSTAAHNSYVVFSHVDGASLHNLLGRYHRTAHLSTVHLAALCTPRAWACWATTAPSTRQRGLAPGTVGSDS